MPKIPNERDDPEDRTRYRTGPNVDTGLEPGAVTQDPETAPGLAAAQARAANKATTGVTDEGVEIVTPKEPTYSEGPTVPDATGVSDPDAPAVDKQSAAAKRKNSDTIANEPEDIKADPKADVQ